MQFVLYVIRRRLQGSLGNDLRIRLERLQGIGREKFDNVRAEKIIISRVELFR